MYRRLNSGGQSQLTSGGCSSLGNVLTCTDTGLTNGLIYHYQISAVNTANLEGPKSREVIGEPNSPTRFYFSSKKDPALTNVEPSRDWEINDSSAFFRSSTSTVKSASELKVFSAVATYVLGTQFDYVLSQYISPPLASQTIGGTVKGQLVVSQGISPCVCNSAVIIRIVSNDGSVIRGTLASFFPPSLNVDSQYPLLAFEANRRFPPATNIPVTMEVQSGDRIVIELGNRSFASGDSQTVYFVGESGSADLPEDESDGGSDKNPWLEFSETILFQ